MRGCGVRQTACRFCGTDIEGHHPYRRGEWRDRGNNSTCGPYEHRGSDGLEVVQPPAGQHHAPVRHRDIYAGSTSNAINF